MPADLPIRDATQTDIDAISGVLTAAAARTPLGIWLYPDALDRDRHLHTFLTRWVTTTIQHGHVRCIHHPGAHLAAAALWITCPTGDGSPFAVPDGRVPGRRDTLRTCLTGCHPRLPHEHLLLFAVRPNQQRRTLATTLLTDQQRTGIPPTARYALAAVPASSRLLHRLGYQLGTPHPLPDGGPAITPAWRAMPRTAIYLRPSTPNTDAASITPPRSPSGPGPGRRPHADGPRR
jgi:hypothetical protein